MCSRADRCAPAEFEALTGELLGTRATAPANALAQLWSDDSPTPEGCLADQACPGDQAPG